MATILKAAPSRRLLAALRRSVSTLLTPPPPRWSRACPRGIRSPHPPPLRPRSQLERNALRRYGKAVGVLALSAAISTASRSSPDVAGSAEYTNPTPTGAVVDVDTIKQSSLFFRARPSGFRRTYRKEIREIDRPASFIHPDDSVATRNISDRDFGDVLILRPSRSRRSQDVNTPMTPKDPAAALRHAVANQSPETAFRIFRELFPVDHEASWTFIRGLKRSDLVDLLYAVGASRFIELPGNASGRQDSAQHSKVLRRPATKVGTECVAAFCCLQVITAMWRLQMNPSVEDCRNLMRLWMKRCNFRSLLVFIGSTEGCFRVSREVAQTILQDTSADIPDLRSTPAPINFSRDAETLEMLCIAGSSLSLGALAIKQFRSLVFYNRVCPSDRMMIAMIRCLIDRGKTAMALSLLRKVESIHTLEATLASEVRNEILRGFINENKFHEASLLLQRFSSADFEVHLILSLVRGLADVHLTQRATKLLLRFLETQTQQQHFGAVSALVRKTVKAVLDALVRQSRLNSARVVALRARKAGVIMDIPMLNGANETLQSIITGEMVRRLAAKSPKKKSRRTRVTVHTVEKLSAVSNALKLSTAKMIDGEHDSSSFRVPVPSPLNMCNHLKNALSFLFNNGVLPPLHLLHAHAASHESITEALEFIHIIQSLGFPQSLSRTYNALIAAAPPDMELTALYNAMSESHAKPDEHTYRALLERTTSITEAFDIFSALDSIGKRPGANEWSVLMRIATWAGDMNVVQESLENLSRFKGGQGLSGAVASTLLKMDSPENAISYLASNERGDLADAVAVRALTLMGKCNQAAEAAQRMISQFDSRYRYGDDRRLSIAIGTLGLIGRIEDAVSLLEMSVFRSSMAAFAVPRLGIRSGCRLASSRMLNSLLAQSIINLDPNNEFGNLRIIRRIFRLFDSLGVRRDRFTLYLRLHQSLVMDSELGDHLTFTPQTYAETVDAIVQNWEARYGVLADSRILFQMLRAYITSLKIGELGVQAASDSILMLWRRITEMPQSSLSNVDQRAAVYQRTMHTLVATLKSVGATEVAMVICKDLEM